jgi:hypothetical protein
VSAIVGRVIDSDGAAVPNATVVVILPNPRKYAEPLMSAVTDESGRFTFEGLPQQGYTVGVGEKAMLGTLHDVIPGEHEALVKLPRLGSLQGRLEGFDIGAVSVSIFITDEASVSTFVTDGSNEFRLDGIPEGEWWISATNGADVGLARVRVPFQDSGGGYVLRAGRGRLQGVVEGGAPAASTLCHWGPNLHDTGLRRLGMFDPGPDREFDILVPEGIPLFVECQTPKFRGRASVAAVPSRGVVKTSVKLEEERGSKY